MVNWDNDRLPVAFRPMQPTTHPASRKAHALFCAMVPDFVPPLGAHTSVGEGDAGSGSQANMKRVMQRHERAPDRHWGFVVAMPRTWKPVADKAINDWVTHVPKQ
jgi:hypothetical protein